MSSQEDQGQRLTFYLSLSWSSMYWAFSALKSVPPCAALVALQLYLSVNPFPRSCPSPLPWDRFNFSCNSWLPVNAAGRVPRARYRATCVVHSGCMYLFGGHDGTRHLNDVHVFDFEVRLPSNWTQLLILYWSVPWVGVGGDKSGCIHERQKIRLRNRRLVNAERYKGSRSTHAQTTQLL